MKTPFLGPAYVARSRNLAYQQLINLYLSVVETKSGKNVGAFYGCPGLNLVTTIGSGPIRALKTAANGTTLYAVSGQNVYSLTTSFAATQIGTLAAQSTPVSIITNTSQAAFFDGQTGHSWNGSAFGTLSLPFSNPVIGAYQDTFGLVNFAGVNSWAMSNSNDLTTWNGLGFSSADGTADPVQAIIDLHREVFLFKSNSTEVWVDVGSTPFAFQRLDGVYIEHGCQAPYSVCKADDTICWLGQNEQGGKSMYKLKGYAADPISTDAISFALSDYPTVSDCISYSYRQEGHTFVVFQFPSADATWVYDMSESEMLGMPVWHQRASFSNGQFHRHWSNSYAFFNNRHLIGDFQTGNIYSYDLNTLTDNGTQRKWLRSWPATEGEREATQRFNALRIDMESGITLPSGTNPQMMLQWSDDGGHNWSDELFQSVGKTGITAPYTRFKRLGSTRRNTGYDRIFQLSSTDQFKVALIGALLQ